MTNYIKNNDVSGYKDYIASMSSDYGLNDRYQDYIDSLLNNIDNLDVPLVSDEYVNGHEAKDINEITNEEDLGDIFVTAMNLKPEERIKMQKLNKCRLLWSRNRKHN